ncbi:unnamed protein product [Lampetra planeri]
MALATPAPCDEEVTTALRWPGVSECRELSQHPAETLSSHPVASHPRLNRILNQSVERTVQRCPTALRSQSLAVSKDIPNTAPLGLRRLTSLDINMECCQSPCHAIEEEEGDGEPARAGLVKRFEPSLEVSRPAVGHFIFVVVVVVTVVTDDYVPARADAFDGSLLRNGSRRATESRKPDGANFPALRLAK